MEYLNVLPTSAVFQLETGLEELTYPARDISFNEALKEANDFNNQKHHPDVWVYITHSGNDVIQLVDSSNGDNRIVGFAVK